MFKKSALLVFYWCLASSISCSPSGEHRPVAGSSKAQQTNGDVVGFEKVKPIFASYCAGCHPSRSAPNWLDYNQAKPFAENGRLYQRIVVQKTMPPQGSPQAAALSQDDRNLIGQWAQSGGQKQSQSGDKTSAPALEPQENVGAAQACLQCHGVGNPASKLQPRIARINGQNEEYLKMQLRRFKWRERIDPSNTMNDMAAALSDSEINEVAAFFAKPKKSTEPDANKIEKLNGPEKFLFSMGEKYAAVNCVSCHMNTDNDRLPSAPLVPILSGQSKQYLIDQLLYFRDNERRSPLMHEFAKGLSNESIEALAVYFTTVDDGH